MKTKALLLTAALAAAAASNSTAQVYSVNAVGYVNVTLKKGFNLIANPLKNGGNTLNEILPGNCGLPDDTTIQIWDPTLGTIGGLYGELPQFISGYGWEPAGPPLPPGKGFYLFIPFAAPQATYTVTFVGEVMTGPLSNPVSGNYRYNALASQVPQAGKVTTDLGLQPANDDLIQVWDKNASRFSSKAYQYSTDLNAWIDDAGLAEPEVGVGDAFFLFRQAATPNAWTRTFNINP